MPISTGQLLRRSSVFEEAFAALAAEFAGLDPAQQLLRRCVAGIHAFLQHAQFFDDYLDGYDGAAFPDVIDRLVDFFEKHLPGNPKILVLNKSDRYTDEETAQLLAVLRRHADGLVRAENVIAAAADPRPERVIVNADLSLAGGAIRGWDRKTTYYFQMIQSLATHYDFDLETPFNELPKKLRDIVLSLVDTLMRRRRVFGTVAGGLFVLLALAILLPMVSSVLVAVGLVPLLARRLAAPAALQRIEAVLPPELGAPAC